MRETTDRRPAGAFRRAAALSALALLVTLLTPVLQSPAAAAPGEVDVSVELTTPPPAGPLRVGERFAFRMAPVVDYGDVSYYLVNTTVTYVVPDEFRVDQARTTGQRDYECAIEGQEVTCLWNAGGTVSGEIQFVVTPVATGDDIESTLSISVNQPELDPDPTPNEVSFTRDVVASTVDLSVSASAYPSSGQVGEPFAYYSLVTGQSGPGLAREAVDVRFEQVVPDGLSIESVTVDNSEYDVDGEPVPQSGSCTVTGQTVACSGMDVRRDLTHYVAVSVIPSAPVVGLSTTVSVSANGVTQTEVVPDPTPNTAEVLVDVASNMIPSDVTGRVADAAGSSLVGVEVAYFAAGDAVTPTASTMSDSDGRYAISQLPVGSYQVRYTPPPTSPLAVQWTGAATARSTAQSVEVDGSGGPVVADETLIDLDPSHVDVGALLYADPVEQLGGAFTYTGEIRNHGRTVDGVRVADATDVSAVVEVPAGFTIEDASLGSPFPEPTVSCPVSGQVVTCSGFDVAVGEYWYVYVTVTPTVVGGGLTADLTVTASEPEVVVDPNPNVSTVSLRVTSGADPSVVTGIVTDAGGIPVADVAVWAYLPADGFVPPAGAWTLTDANGQFSFPALASGSYALRYGPPAGSGYAAQWSGGSTTRGAVLTVVDGSGAPVDVSEQLAFPVGSLRGTVRGPGAAPAAGVAVLAFQPGVFFFPAASTVTAADGSYTLSGLGQGSYEVTFRPPGGSGLGTEWFDDSPSRGGATPVEVFGFAVAVADADLVATGSMAGTVTGATGSPLAGTRVVLFAPSDTWAGSYEVVTAADGTYALPALPADTYRVRFVPPAASGLAPQWFDGVTLRAAATPVVVTGGGAASGIDAAWVP